MIQRLRNRITTSEREGGFTLVELLVVMIIIAILLAIAIPSYLGFRDRANQKVAEANVREAVPAAEAYFVDNGTYVGMDAAALQAIDQGVSPTLTVVGAAANAYCLQDSKGGQDASYTGPGGTVVQAVC